MSGFQEKVNFIWELADLLRGPYKKNEYQKVILPFTVLKRFDSVLEHSKKDVIELIETYDDFKGDADSLYYPLIEKAVDKDGNQLGFYNYSKYDFKSLLADPENIEENLIHYIDSFSKNVQDIFENFYIKSHITRLAKVNKLFLLMKKFSDSKVDLHPNKVSNHEMGTIFEELIRRFAEQSNEEAGEHFTPRDVVKLMTQLIFIENGVHLKGKNLIKKIYDPACGTGGMLTSCKDFINELNDSVEVVLYGQELNEEIYAICKADLLIKGEDAGKIKGPSSTLSNDQFPEDKFDFMISNPPYGTKWESDEDVILKEAEKGFEGRFGAGIPRKDDGTFLFFQHLISKMKKNEKSRIAIITNSSPLFSGDAGQGPTNIRKWIIEHDLIETIIGLPDQLFYNTSIKTYIWILTNQKPAERKGKIQLVDATSNFKKMKRSLGEKRKYLPDKDINEIMELFKNFKVNEKCKIFDTSDFGYTKVTIELPLQLNYQVNDDRLENLYAVKQFKELAISKNKNPELKLIEEEEGIKKQNKISDALKQIGNQTYYDWDLFESKIKESLDEFELSKTFIKNIITALSEHDEDSNYVTDSRGKKKINTKLRNYEKIPLNQSIEDYFEKEVKVYYPDSWMDRTKDKVGYEINFTKYFYKYQPPRALEVIKTDIKDTNSEIQELIKEDLDET